MTDSNIIDNFIDDREFRNYVVSLLPKLGYELISIDDIRISDEDIENNNDVLARKDGRRYAIQTYLNQDITYDEINEAILDKLFEHTSYALIITNKCIDKDVKEKAEERNLALIDREDLIQVIPQE
ncbi:MAG: restriction endonuclease [Bacilli bacterium]|nr:restriction endonuclease [Bacilli bacterium]